jgi:cytochrome c oxidase subunit 2
MYIWFCDTPAGFLQLGFQDPASTSMDGIYLFNSHLLFVIINIVLLVWWFIYLITQNFFDERSSKNYIFTHSNIIEIVWTTIPALILLSLASPSFSLLYSLDEITNPELTLKILGHQWYWTYEISDFKYCSLINKDFKFSCYLLTNDFLKNQDHLGLFRLLETNKRVILPTNTHIRLLITAVDVLHSWTIPSFGIKVDACPGRLNQSNLFIKRFGVFLASVVKFVVLIMGSCQSLLSLAHLSIFIIWF